MGTGTTTEVPVSSGTSVTVAAEVTDSARFEISGPISWTVRFTSESEAIDVTDLQVTWIDAPLARDFVVLRKTEGITWSVGTAEFTPESFGEKTEIFVKATKDSEVRAHLLGDTTNDPADFPKTFGNPLTSDATVTYAEADLVAAVNVGDNPLDRGKGYGKGASLETVEVTGIAGIKWKIGSATRVQAVKPGVLACLPVDPDDIGPDGEVLVAPVPDKGYEITPTNPDPATEVTIPLDFTDGAQPVIEAPVTYEPNDRGGAGSDTLVLPGRRGMTWWVGQKDPQTHKGVYKAQKVGQDGNVTYKVKHIKGATTATTVYLKPVADRGYVVSTRGLRTSHDFSPADKAVGTGHDVSGQTVALTTTEGIDSWAIGEIVAGRTVTTAIRGADLVAAGVSELVVTTKAPGVKVKVTSTYAKDYTA